MDAGARPALTYTPHGGSRDLDPARIPAGFRAFRHEAAIGSGAERWAEATAAVLEWGLQRGAGIRVSTPRVAVGDDVTLTIPLLGFVPVRAYARVVVQGFSRPAPGVCTLATPVLRLVQAIYTKRYLRALARTAH